MAKIPAYPATKREIREYDLDSSETFERGAAVKLASDEEIEECGSDPSAVLGFALHDAAVLPETTKMLVAVAEGGLRFWLQGDNDPTSSDVNQEYGIAKDGDGIWYVDGTDTSNTVVYVIDVDTTKNLYLVKVLESNRQISG